MALRCPDCNCAHSRVTNTVEHEITVRGKTYVRVRRRRVCRRCGKSYHGEERREGDPDVENSDNVDVSPTTPDRNIDLPPANPFL